MKALIQAVAVVAALVLPAVSFAQSVKPVAGADDSVQIIQIEEIGYVPAADQSKQSADVQTAQPDAVRQAGANDASGASGASGYGGVADSTSNAGDAFHPGYDVGMKSIYLHH